MNPANDWKQSSVDALFIAAEAVVWYILAHIAATALEQTYLSQLAERVRLATSAADPADASRAGEALAIIERAATQEHGPSLLVVLAAAFGGFALMRGLMRLKFDGVLGAVVLLAASVLALNVLLHVGLTGDLRFWDPRGLMPLFEDPGDLAARSTLTAFVRDPGLDHPHGATVGFVAVFLMVLWGRFAAAARSRVTFERVLRSFTAGFVFTILGLAFAAMQGIQAAQVFAIPQFVLGMLALAVANNARASAPTDGARRTGPWLASVGGTVAVLLAVAALLGVLAFLNVGVLLNAAGEVAWQIIAFLLIIFITPIYWLIELIVRFLLPNGLVGLPELPNLQLGPPPEANGTEEALGWHVPMWAQNGLKFLAVMLILYVLYRVALALMKRRRTFAGGVDEVRGQSSSALGIGAILRGMLPGLRRSAGDEWLKRHPVYRLYARAARAAEDRGFRYLEGETPLEFARRADRAMSAPPYPPIGLAFDRARYGRHYPEEGAVRSMEAALASWEAATPATEELRHRLAGAQPLTETQEFMLTVAQRKRVIQRARPRRDNEPDRDENNRPVPMV
ncbi:MAG: DUF4129 domain-containing protein [Dehalococcoidia bacterium]